MEYAEVNSPQPQEVAAVPVHLASETAPLPNVGKKTSDEEYSRNMTRCVSALEHSTVKVPYECLNRKFRSVQKLLDREEKTVVNFIQTSNKEVLPKVGSTSSMNKKEVTSIIKTMRDHVTSLKRKAKEAVISELECARAVKRRVDHLQSATIGSETERFSWERTRFDRILTDYLLREGCYNTAKKLVETRNLKDLTNLEIFETAHDVEKSLQRKEVAKCLAWCHENKSKLKKLNSNLEFNLRLQEFIEMIKKDQRMDAVWHARKHFNTADSDHLNSIQRVMALLAFPTDTNIEEYRTLLSDNRWEALTQQFRSENLRIFQLSPQCSLNAVLQAGLSALKTPQCYNTRNDTYCPECPVCLPHLNVLAKNLPFAHCSQSRMVCGISGDRMNENNHPLMLPNGHVYGTRALENMALQNNGNIICPRTQTTYRLTETKKVYVM